MTNAIATNNGGAVAKQEPEAVRLLKLMGPEIARALPKHVSPERMARVALTALRTTPKLLECSTSSILGSIMSAAQLGLEPNTPLGLAYLVPYKGTCQLIVGYQGYLELARRSGLVACPYAHVVREGDRFRWSLGLAPTLEHVPSSDPERESRPITHVYAVAHQRGESAGPPVFVVLTAAQVEARKQRSAAVRAGRPTPWDTDPEAMTLKTAIRALWRWLPKTAEMGSAAAIDDAEERGSQVESWDPSTTALLQSAGLTIDAPPAETPQIEAPGQPTKAARVLGEIRRGKAARESSALPAAVGALSGATGQPPTSAGAALEPDVNPETGELGYREPGAEG